MPRRGLAAVLALSSLVALTGCALGERPYFTEQPFETGTMTGDPAVDAVLTKLDAVGSGPLTAAYSGRVNFQSKEFTAVVLLDGASSVVTLSNAIFRDTPSGSQTCTVDGTRECEPGINPALASDTQLTMDFYASAAAVRLRNKASRKIGPGTARNETFAGQPATCVDLPLPAAEGTAVATYCVLDNGVLAQIVDGDVTLELVMYANSVDATQFTLQ